MLLVAALVLAVFLRALVAPHLSRADRRVGTAGRTRARRPFFQAILGRPELNYFVPLAAGVPLVALGSDYSISPVAHIWSEAERLPINGAITAAPAAIALLGECSSCPATGSPAATRTRLPEPSA